jgi:ribosomal protein S18 acetylase RimI-like enzyme
MTAQRLPVRPVRDDERGWLVERLQDSWGAATVVSRGRVRDGSRLPALVCTDGAELVGVATYEVAGAECELVTIDAFRPREGIGTALLAAVAEEAASRGCRRVWLVTTNDNVDALRFYQRRGFRLVAVHVDAIEHARALKPEIPQIGAHGIPIRDELELELALTDVARGS